MTKKPFGAAFIGCLSEGNYRFVRSMSSWKCGVIAPGGTTILKIRSCSRPGLKQ